MTTEKVIEIYKDLYSLPELTQEEEVSFDFLKQCRRDYKFVIIVICNEKKEFLLIRDLNKNIGWELIGGYIEKSENIEDAVNRVVLKEVGVGVDELEPIAVLNNIFKWRNNKVLHKGIAFIAFSKERIKEQPHNIKTMYTEKIPEKMVYQNKKILDIAKLVVVNKFSELPYREIESVKRFFIFHIIHRYFVRFFGLSASREIKKQIFKLIFGNPKSIIDVCCGDDNFIFALEKRYRPELCIANDISWKILSLLKNKQKKSNVFLTNHNVLKLPFSRKFDLIIFKNTLHHIQPAYQINLIKKLADISKQLIIIDIVNPAKSDLLSKIWHWYYVRFLGDKGDYFLNYEEFKERVKNNIRGKKMDFGILKTIKGKYFYGSLFDIIEGDEVEIKARLKDIFHAEKIKKELIKLGASFCGEEEEKDVYFTASYRDFIKSRECLRIREKKDASELTYKGPTTSEMIVKKQFWKSEINIPIIKGREEELGFLLEQLGFKKVAVVKKKRQKFIIRKQIVNIDKVENLGFFIEIEQLAENLDEREKALKENIEILREIGLDKKDFIEEPYRDLVRKNYFPKL